MCHDHNKEDTDEEHKGISGYSYNSDACLACHPVGTGRWCLRSQRYKLSTHCVRIRVLNAPVANHDGYAATSSQCIELSISQILISPLIPIIHRWLFPTTAPPAIPPKPGWSPATFPVHNDYYVLAGAHTVIANDCAVCHNGDFTNTPNTCVGCHIDDYDNTSDPNHQAAGYSQRLCCLPRSICLATCQL